MIRVLIADDEELERKAFRLIIQGGKGGDIELVEAVNGREAAEKAAAGPLDAVFLDVRMPGMDGIEAARVIRAIRPEAPIVFLTAFDSFDYAREALRIGVDEYLLKPASAEQIREALSRALRAGEARRAGAAGLAREIRAALGEGRRFASSLEDYRALAWPELPEAGPCLCLAFRLEPRQGRGPGGESAGRDRELDAAALGGVASLAERLLRGRGWRALAGAGDERGFAVALRPPAAGVSDEEPRGALTELREGARRDLGLVLLAGAACSAEGGVEALRDAAAAAASLARPERPLVTTRCPEPAAAGELSAGAAGLRGRESPSRFVYRALAIMAGRLGEDLSLESVAAELRVSASHLSRRFASTAGAGFGECLARMRVERAKGLLDAGASVKEAAALVGYRDPAYFARVFRRLEGASPAEYRERPAAGPAARRAGPAAGARGSVGKSPRHLDRDPRGE